MNCNFTRPELRVFRSPTAYASPAFQMLRLLTEGPVAGGNGHASAPAVGQANLKSDQNQARLVIALPGVKADSIEIEVQDRKLLVRGKVAPREVALGALNSEHRVLSSELAQGEFVRIFTLPFGVNRDRVEAHFEDGLLRIELPKAETEKPRKIEIKVAQP
jgi:HSP20 family protein